MSSTTRSLALRSDMSVAVMTGAGISAESGIATFRDPGGIWQKYDMEKVGTLRGFLSDPDGAWRLFSELREHTLRCDPNPAHLALVRLEDRLSENGLFTLVTQNVDGLHRRAGSTNVLPIHGSLFRTKCSADACGMSERSWDDERAYESAPICPECGAPLRPDVVLFGEFLDPDIEEAGRLAIRDCDVFLVVGTSGVVYPAAGYVALAAQMGARTVLVNLDEPENLSQFNEFHEGKAGELLPSLLDF